MPEMGRPVTYRNKKTFPLQIENDDLKAFRKICGREGVNLSSKLQDLIKIYNKAHGKGNPCFPITKWSKDPNFMAFPTLGEKPNLKQIKVMSEKDILELSNNVKKYVNALNGRVHDINWNWSWGSKQTDSEIVRPPPEKD